jgi:hypothetical protein
MTKAYDGRQVVGMDPHRQRNMLVRMTEDGRKLETVRIEISSDAWAGRLDPYIDRLLVASLHPDDFRADDRTVTSTLT